MAMETIIHKSKNIDERQERKSPYKGDKFDDYMTKWTTQIRIIEELTNAKFILALSIAITREAKDSFHHNFQIGTWAHPLKYEGVNLGIMFKVQKLARERQELKC